MSSALETHAQKYIIFLKGGQTDYSKWYKTCWVMKNTFFILSIVHALLLAKSVLLWVAEKYLHYYSTL